MKIAISLGKDAYAIVDDTDSIEVSLSSWHLTTKGYVRARVKGKLMFLHELIARRMGLKGQIDHKDGDPLNCCRENLREASPSQSNANRGSSSKSGYKGVHKKEVDFELKLRMIMKYVF